MTPEFATALSAMQEKFSTIPKNKEVSVRMKTGGTYTYTYATLEKILDTVRPILAECGFSMVSVASDLNLTTILSHASGDSISATLPLHATSDPKALGSEISYLRRYQAVMILGLVTEGEDDDGGAASDMAHGAPAKKSAQSKPPQTPPKSNNSRSVVALWTQLGETLKAIGMSREEGESLLRGKMNELFDKDSTKALTDQETNQLIKWLHDMSTSNQPPE